MNPLDLQKEISRMRSGAGLSPAITEIKNQVKIFQNKRLESTHQNLLQSENTRPAARFFLDRLYGTGSTHKRDQQVERVIPKAQRILPSVGVEVVQQVLHMDWLAEQMDVKISIQLNELGYKPDTKLEVDAYLEAFYAAGQFEVRRQQVQAVSATGERLVRLMRFPMLKTMLSMTRGAAHKANLEDFHEFLVEGVSAFKSLQSPQKFFQAIESEEMVLLEFISSRRFKEIPEKFFCKL
ncbi:MAG: hypothetical protein QE278_05580 [Limnobacter sp.]|nr:hypothetical protein [Limnobacter sp.]